MISVVIPTRNSSSNLADCLDSVIRLTKKPKEVIVVFDSEQDSNIGLVKKHGARAVFDRNGTIGSAYYAGAKAAESDFIAFTDDDCIVPDNWIETAEKELEEDIDILGGEDLLPEKSPFFQQAAYQIDLARMREKILYGKEAEKRLRAANIVYRKSIFEKENFNPRLKGLQEPEFNHRLLKKGYRMKFNPSMFVYHKRRSSLKGIFFQIYRNGKAKIDLIKIHRAMLSAIDVLPVVYAAFTMLMAYLTLTSDIVYFRLWAIATVSYFLFKPMIIIARTRQIKFYPHLFFIVLVREVAYALGILAGLKKLMR